MGKKFLLLLVLVFWMANLSAQNEFLNKSNSIKPLNSGVNMSGGTSSTGGNSIYTPNVFKTDKSSSAPKSTIPEKKIDMTTQEFINSNESYANKLNEKIQVDEIGISRDRQAFRRDSNLGTFKTMSQTVTVSYRDYGDVDQDFIKISVNDVAVRGLIFLESTYKTVKVGLVKGNNTLSFEALNTGTQFPNTAEFMVTDEDGNVITSNMWALDTGFKAMITIQRN